MTLFAWLELVLVSCRMCGERGRCLITDIAVFARGHGRRVAVDKPTSESDRSSVMLQGKGPADGFSATKKSRLGLHLEILKASTP
jgi:hypothetical protein